MTPAFTEIPPDDRGYRGMTRYTATDGRTFACMGVGEDVREALVAEKGRRDG